ncbi:YdcH family protein [Vitreimonas flagellata]|uniref:YdcH family protein n=1 Tax=Vitreimonas flagellata TaxID=2560861 RepID=UPI0010750311|nr:DUF465 domain-containing protein [Vitreimonas flagellata]
MQVEHLDQALAEEFAGHGETIHKLKIADPHFKTLMEKNHQLWTQIQNIQNGLTPASDVTLETLEKQRLHLLDEIAACVRKAEV